MTPADVLGRVTGCPVLVVGDLILDEFVWGTARRISPEAPVPVVEVHRRTYAPGGAANAAANAAGLGGRVALVGVAGADPAGDRLTECLRAGRVADIDVVRDPARPTTTKTRVVAHGQQVVRFDHEDTAPVPATVRDAVLARVRALLPAARGCILSDYGKGAVGPEVAGEVIAAAARAGVPVVVDPKGADYRKYRGATLVKPNQAEAGVALGRGVATGADVAAAGPELVARQGGRSAVLITRGPDGMTLFEPGRPPAHVPARAREVFDVTGAGDTVTGVLGVGLAAGIPLLAGCRLAAAAAAVVLGKRGTAAIDAGELVAYLAAAPEEDEPPHEGPCSGDGQLTTR